MKRLTVLPVPAKTPIAAANAVLLEYAAQTNGVAVAIFKKFVAGTTGTQKDLSRLRKQGEEKEEEEEEEKEEDKKGKEKEEEEEEEEDKDKGEDEDEDEDESKEGDEEEGGAEGGEGRDAAPHGPNCIDPADPVTRDSFPTLNAHSARETTAQDESGSKNR
jgi:hypothetical protein